MYEPLKGFRDFYPDEMAARRAVIDTVEDVARRYGFREVGTPRLEHAEMWAEASGGAEADMSPEEIAESIAFLLSSDARQINGQNLRSYGA